MAEAINFDYCNGRQVTVTYEDLKDTYVKKHHKIPEGTRVLNRHGQLKESWMRVENGATLITIECAKLAPGEEILAKVLVSRTREALTERSNTGKTDSFVKGEVPLDCDAEKTSEKTWQLKVNLDSIYQTEENGEVKEVYALSTGKRPGPNMFQLVTEVYIRQRKQFEPDSFHIIWQEYSKPFLLVSEERAKASTKRSPKRRCLHNTQTFEHYMEEMERTEYSKEGHFGWLKADAASIRELRISTFKVYGRRDIGYHFPLKDITQVGDCSEGDIVGLFADENHKSYIEKLNMQNYKKAKLGGVITNSFHLEGLCKESLDGATDIVAVIGIVPVRVMGPVHNGEQLFAFPKKAGCAATLSRISLEPKDDNEKPILLGQALESKLDVNVNEESLVSSFVSVVNGIDFLATYSVIKKMEKELTKAMDLRVKKVSKQTNWTTFWLTLLLFIALTAIGLSLWQKYGQNTLFRKSICKRGSLDEQTMTFTYTATWQKIVIHGLEYSFQSLNDKLYKKVTEREGQFRYFINYGRCCYNGASYGNEYIEGAPFIGGPEILSSDMSCSVHSIAYFNDGKWLPMEAGKRKVVVTNCYGRL